VPLDFSRYSERRHKIEKCSSPFILSLLWVMRVKAKTWGVIGQTIFSLSLSGGGEKTKIKSQLQTVLITASGPQAWNALVHRKRYTQGSRQNRCVSSQNALALRARVRGTGKASAPATRPSITVVKPSGSLTVTYDRCWRTVTTDLRRRQKPSAPGTPAWSSPAAPEKLSTQNCLRRGIQLYN